MTSLRPVPGGCRWARPLDASMALPVTGPTRSTERTGPGRSRAARRRERGARAYRRACCSCAGRRSTTTSRATRRCAPTRATFSSTWAMSPASTACAGPPGPPGSTANSRSTGRPPSRRPLPNWPGLGDRLVVYRRNAVRRALAQRDRCPGCGRYLPTGAIGRCDRCFTRHPPAMALQVNGQRVEYPAEVVAAMPEGLRRAFERSPSLLWPPAGRLDTPPVTPAPR